MTTTVTVRARAHGAVVETNGETIQVSPGQERQFHIEEGTQQFSVTQPAEAPADRAAQLADEEVPGARQNDELLGQGQPASPPTGNETGADETAQTTEGTTRRGR